MSATEETLALLRSIDVSLKQIAATMRTAQPKPVASDRDLDGKYGDPVLKFTVRDWSGPSYKGRRFSECPPELLDMVADCCDYFALKAEQNDEHTDRGKPVAGYKRADAARARGWAKRIRDGVHTAPATASNGTGQSSDWDDESGAGDWN